MLTLHRSLSTRSAVPVLAALLLVAGIASPVAALAKKVQTTPFYSQNDTTYQYVSSVFDKLQSYWETQAYDQRLNTNAVLTFTLNDQGSLLGSKLDAPSGDPMGAEALAFLKKNAPFGPLPETLTGNRMEFSFKLTPGSLQMVSYRVVEDRRNRNSDVISYASPVSATPAASSLFYARVVDTDETPKAGKVWDKAESRNSDEQAMEHYIGGVRESIQNNWRQPEDFDNFAPARALLQIDRDGSLLSASLTQSSGSKVIDKAILNTIYQSAPFKDAPNEVKSLPVTLEYVFEPVVSTVSE
jgi:TonB family protein